MMNIFKLPTRVHISVILIVIAAALLFLQSCNSAPSSTGNKASMDEAKNKADKAKAMAEGLNAPALFPSQYEMGEKSYSQGLDSGSNEDFQLGTESFISAEQHYMESYQMAKKAMEEAEQAIKHLNDSIRETEVAMQKAIKKVKEPERK